MAWGIDEAAHKLAFDLFYRGALPMQNKFPAGIVGVGRLFVQDSKTKLFEPWPTVSDGTHDQCTLKLVSSASDSDAGLQHTIEFAAECPETRLLKGTSCRHRDYDGGGGDGDRLPPLPIAQDTQLVRTTMSATGVEAGTLDDGQRLAFELEAPRDVPGCVRRLVFVPTCAIEQRKSALADVVEVVGDGDDQWGTYEMRGEPFALSAELFEAAVVLAVYSSHNCIAKGLPIAGGDGIRNHVGSPQGPVEPPGWQEWYRAKYVDDTVR